MIVFVAMAIPHYAARGLNWLIVGNSYRRQLLTGSETTNYLRDSRLTGHPYKIRGLDSLFEEEARDDDEECYDGDDDDSNNNKKDGGKDD